MLMVSVSQKFRQGTRGRFSSALGCLGTQVGGPAWLGVGGHFWNGSFILSLWRLGRDGWKAGLTWAHSWLEDRYGAFPYGNRGMGRLLPWWVSSPEQVSQENQAEAPWFFWPSQSIQRHLHQVLLAASKSRGHTDSTGDKWDFASWWGHGKVTLQKNIWDGRYCGDIFRKLSATTLNKMIIKSSEPSGRFPQGTWLIKSLLIVKVLRVACTFNLTDVFHWPRNLAFCIMKSNKTQSWALRLHTGYLLPERLHLLPLSTRFYTDLVLPWDGFHGIPRTVLSAATLAGPQSSLCPFREPSSELWGVRQMGPAVPTALVLTPHVHVEIPYTWVLLCHAGSLRRKCFPSWPKWTLASWNSSQSRPPSVSS